MSEGITFRLFEDADAGQVADLLNRNRFYAARHKHITAEDYLHIQRGRGVLFSVIAVKKDQVIGLAGAYFTANQQVVGANCIFIGTFLVDMHSRLSYSVVMGLYEKLFRELLKRGYKEILSVVVPSNTQSYFLMLKYGFELLDGKANDLGRWVLHNYSPALLRFADKEGMEIDVAEFFSNLPVVNKKVALEAKGKEIFGGRCIECDYKYQGKNVVLLFDIVNYKIDGVRSLGGYKIYPGFEATGRYVAENLGKKHIDFPIHMVMEPGCGVDDVRYDISLSPGQTQVIDCGPNVAELKISFSGVWHRFFPNQLEKRQKPKEQIRYDHGQFAVLVDPDSGFLNIIRAEDEAALAKILWPCVTVPYLEGALAPRIKDLQIQKQDGAISITEKTDAYQMTRLCKVHGDKITITTTLKCSGDGDDVAPISQVYAEKGLDGYALKFGDAEEAFEWSETKHDGYEYADYAFWDADPERFGGRDINGISLMQQTSVIGIVPDKKCKPVINAPMFTFFLDFDRNRVTEEQIIEEMEVHCRVEEI
ncbi:MAG: hypothetical protein FWC93_06390 [Defluviitaleaceae bacterium]|nr:hypothetical protein [Defluviitaleaceae bacterium]